MELQHFYGLYEARQDYFFKRSMPLVMVLLVLVGVGVGMLGSSFSVQPRAAWGAVLLNNLFFFHLSLGGVVLGLIQEVCGAQWGRPIKRLHEVFGLFFYVSCSVFILFLLAVKYDVAQADEVYRWIADPSMLDHFPGKNEWLVEDFFLVRVIALLVAMMVVVALVRRQTLLADGFFLAGDMEKAYAVARLVAQRLRFWSAPILLFLGVTFTFVTIDLTMSLAPLWFSTLWAGWLFAVMMQMLLAATLVVMFVVKKGGIGGVMFRQQFHDVGKLLHGFSAFWAYLTYAHILTYWYGNIPEETEYFIHRLHSPWTEIMIAVGCMSFVIPLFVLIPRASKWTVWVTVPLCVMILCSQWLAHVVIVQPEVLPQSPGAGGRFLWAEIGTFCLFFAAFVGVIYVWGRKHLMVPLADVLLHRYLSERH